MADVERARLRLKDREDRLLGLLGFANAEMLDREDRGTLERMPQSGDDELADAATEMFTQEFDLTLCNRFRAELDEVRLALQRVAIGTYGQCVKCGSRIPDTRLEAYPEAAFCIGCAQAWEVQG